MASEFSPCPVGYLGMLSEVESIALHCPAGCGVFADVTKDCMSLDIADDGASAKRHVTVILGGDAPRVAPPTRSRYHDGAEGFPPS
jgi:hypothetical protein